MYAKGLYGLTRAANEFHPFKIITKTIGYNIDENGKKVPASTAFVPAAAGLMIGAYVIKELVK